MLLDGPAESLELRVYSAAENRVAAASAGPFPAGWCRVDLPPSFSAEAPRGLYFARVVARRGALRSLPVRPLRLLLLR